MVMTPMAMTLGVATAIKATVAKQVDAASNVVDVVSQGSGLRIQAPQQNHQTNPEGTTSSRKPIGKPPVYKTTSGVRGFLLLFERWVRTGSLTDDEKAT